MKTKINIGNKKIEVESNGKKTTIDKNGINVEDENIIDAEVCDKEAKKEKKKKFIVNYIFRCIIPVLTTIVYICLGLFLKGNIGTAVNSWAAFWPLFFIPLIGMELMETIRKKDPLRFPIAILVPFIYLQVSMVTNLWHPLWVLFFAIPLYYIVVGPIVKYKKENN